MDVTCERCGTEYEFDETLVSDRGTTVKCTNCGHLFKVFRPEAGAGPKSWHVEQRDGRTRTLGSLKELQRLIASGALSPDDRISRGGDGWKRLGDIAELTSFFESARAALASATDIDASPPRQRRTTADLTQDSRPLARTLDGVAAPHADETTRQSKSTIMGVGALSSGQPSQREPTQPFSPQPPASQPATISSRPPPPPRPPRPPRPAPDATAPARPARRTSRSDSQPSQPGSPPLSRSAPTSESPRQRRNSERPSSQETSRERPGGERPSNPSHPAPRALYLDAHEPVSPSRARSRSGLWVTLVLLLAVGVGVALAWPQIAPHLDLAQAADPARPRVDSGDAALAQDHVPGYERAVHHYTQALAYDDHDHRVLTGLSRAHALWAQALAFDAADLEARADEDPAHRGEAAALRRDVRRHAETALRRGEDAVRHGAGDPDAEVALADALRLTGDLTRARSRLDRALTLRSDAPAETLRVHALIDAADGDLALARPRAEEAVSADPSSIRARLVYARALLAANDVGAARQQVDAILERDGQHPRALALRAAIDEGRPPAPPTLDVPDSGVPDSGVSAADPRAASATSPARAGRGASASPPAGRDYSWYVRSGDEQRARGDMAKAREHYEAARRVRPSGSEALTGLGYADLQGGNAASAANLFRQAAGQGYAEAYLGLGDAYRRLGRDRDALTAYERYTERLPGGPQAAAARQKADALRSQLDGARPDEAPEPGSAAPTAEPAAEPTDPAALPPPREMESPPPADVPAVESDPELQP